MKVRRAVIYCRISKDRAGAGLGVDRQRADCEALAERLGWTVTATYEDNDISAYSGKRRPGYEKLLADIEAGRANAVLAWHTDRLHRSPRELEHYVDICDQYKVVTQTVQAGELDLATPSGRAVARTLGAWARFESEHKSERVKRAKRQIAESGGWVGGAHPIGWHVRDDGSVVLDRVIARHIRQACADVLAGVGVRTIMTAWNRDGFPTANGGEWRTVTVRQTLLRARNAGLVEHRREIVGKSAWPAIVTEDVWRAVRAKLTDPARRSSPSNRAKWLLSGIAVCGANGCGAPLRTTTVGPRDRKTRMVYRCSATGRGHVARNAAEVDRHVDAVIRAYLQRERVGESMAALNVETDEVADLRADAQALRDRLGDYQARAADMDPADFAAATRAVREKLHAVEAQLAAAPNGSLLAGIIDAPDPGMAWDAAGIDRKRTIIRELFTVTILPLPAGAWPRHFDPALVVIDPRG